MLNPDKKTIEWAAQWIEDSLKAETNERTIEFGKNMAMTFRSLLLDSRADHRTTGDAGCEWQVSRNGTVDTECGRMSIEMYFETRKKAKFCMFCGKAIVPQNFIPEGKESK